MNGAEFFIKRTAMGWDLNRAADAFHVNRRTIQRWENGQTPIPFDVGEILEGFWQNWIDSLDHLLTEVDELDGGHHPLHLTAYRDPELAAKNTALAVILEMEDRGIIASWNADGS